MLSEETIQSENKILQDLVVIAIVEYDDKLQRIQDSIKTNNALEIQNSEGKKGRGWWGPPKGTHIGGKEIAEIEKANEIYVQMGESGKDYINSIYAGKPTDSSDLGEIEDRVYRGVQEKNHIQDFLNSDTPHMTHNTQDRGTGIDFFGGESGYESAYEGYTISTTESNQSSDRVSRLIEAKINPERLIERSALEKIRDKVQQKAGNLAICNDLGAFAAAYGYSGYYRSVKTNLKIYTMLDRTAIMVNKEEYK